MRARNKSLARSLRREATWAEKRLWYHLRTRKLRGKKFRRQQTFGPYVLDFYCVENKLNIEIDGGQHDVPENREYDMRRSAFLGKEGVRTLRFWNSQVRENLEGVLARIRMEVENSAPHPDPLPQGEREN